MSSRSVVVVGGTRGLGLELARFYAEDGRDVVVTGREAAAVEACAAAVGGSTRTGRSSRSPTRRTSTRSSSPARR